MPAQIEDKETRRHGDKENILSVSPCLLVSLSVCLGLVLRSYHYLRDRAVWQDEAGLLLTVTARDFGDLLQGRLDYHQAAPPLYLCALKTLSLICGDDSRVLRLPSFLASCAALLLFAWVARRLLSPRAAPWAVCLFAVSEQLLWHASEAKAYSIDVLAAVVVLAVPRHGSLVRSLVYFALLAPLLLLSSYPSCFLCGGVLLAFFPAVYRDGRWRTRLAFAALAATIGGVSLWLLLGPVRRQHDAEIHSCWVACMPCWDQPWTVPGWLILSPFEVCRYCSKPLGQVLAVFAVIGTCLLWRRGERTAVVLLTAPIALAWAAACVHRYPFGGARVMVYAAPAVLLLAAAGTPPVLAWLWLRSRCACLGLIAVQLVPLPSSAWQVIYTWREADVPAAAAYVQAERQPDELVLGNDMAQLYYFRRLGTSFHLLDESPLPNPTSDRLWVVMTAKLSRGERARMASDLAPGGWHALASRDFAYTTVVLFAR